MVRARSTHTASATALETVHPPLSRQPHPGGHPHTHAQVAQRPTAQIWVRSMVSPHNPPATDADNLQTQAATLGLHTPSQHTSRRTAHGEWGTEFRARIAAPGKVRDPALDDDDTLLFHLQGSVGQSSCVIMTLIVSVFIICSKKAHFNKKGV